MKAPTQPPHRHRFDRAETWAKLWLGQLGKYLASSFGFLPPLPRALERECQTWLDQVSKLIAWLLIMRAIAKVRGGPRQHAKLRAGIPASTRGQRTKLRTPLRTILGAKLRRGFTQGSIGERIQFLYRVLSDIDGFACRLGERLCNGFTRLMPILGVYGSPASSLAWFVQAPLVLVVPQLALDTS